MASTTYSDISQKVFKKTISKIPDEIQIERNLELEKAGILIDYKQYYAAMFLVVFLVYSLLFLFIFCFHQCILSFFFFFCQPLS
jgi:hypothetical protein